MLLTIKVLRAGLPVTAISPKIGPALLAEFLFTFALVYVVLNTATVDAARDRELRARVAKMADDHRHFITNDDGSVTIVVGFQAWPFPIPLVKTDAGWQFNTDAGIEELLKRRIGENELTAIATLRAYVDAQRQYAAEPRDGTEVRQFAQKVQSSPGKKDGLYWPADAAKGEKPSPAGPEIKDAKTPYAGY